MSGRTIFTNRGDFRGAKGTYMPPKWVQKLASKAASSFIDHSVVRFFDEDLRTARSRGLAEQREIADHIVQTMKLASSVDLERFHSLIDEFRRAQQDAEKQFGLQSKQYLMTKLAASTHMAIYATRADAKAEVVNTLQKWISELHASPRGSR